MDQYLEESYYADCKNDEIGRFVERVVAGAADDREKAVRLHDAVRDEVKFGWLPGFFDYRASETLRRGVGYCNTKSALFCAALRRAGIPARAIFVDINVDILKHLVDTGDPYVDHSYTEVYLNGKWVRTDSYIVDKELFYKAKALLETDGLPLGYGVNLHGTCEWDGTEDAFAQFVDDGSVKNLTSRRYGEFADSKALHESSLELWNRPSLALRVFFPLYVTLHSNRAVAKVRAC